MRIEVRVTPGAREDEVVGWRDGTLRVRVRAAAEQGKANEAVCRVIGEALGIPKSFVTVTRGSVSRRKLVELEGIDEGELQRRLDSLAR
jgi:uncharacterized protein YggU (UPF0235/DUF167 family)